jgi:hypothetical protein
MPHLPRGFAPTFGDPPDAPAAPAARGETDKTPPRHRLGVGVLSPRTHTVDPDAVVRALFGKEVETDDNTGELVPAG